MSKKSTTIKSIIVLVISVFLFAVLFIPQLNMFGIQRNGTDEAISISQTLMSKNDFQSRDFAFNRLRAFFVDTTKGNVCIEILWYAMMLQYVLGIVVFVGSLMMLCAKKLKSKYNGANTALFGSIAFLITQIAIIVTIAIPKAMSNGVKLAEVITFNVPMLVINLLVAVAAIVLSAMCKPAFKEKKLSEMNK